MEKKTSILLLILLFMVGISIILYCYFNKTNEYNNTNYVAISMNDNDGNQLKSRDIKINDFFAGQLTIESSFSEKRDYLLLIMINDELIDFTLNGDTKQKHYLSFNPKEIATYDIFISNGLNKKINNCNILLISDPTNQSLSEFDKINGKLYSSRFSLLKDEGDIKKSNPIDIKNYINPNYVEDLGFFVNLSPFRDLDEKNSMVDINISYQKNEQLYVHLANKYENTLDYKLYLLKDWNLQPILNDNHFVYFSLNPNEKISIPINLNLTLEDLEKEIIFLLVPEPYDLIQKEDNHMSKQIENSTRFKIVK